MTRNLNISPKLQHSRKKHPLFNAGFIEPDPKLEIPVIRKGNNIPYVYKAELNTSAESIPISPITDFILAPEFDHPKFDPKPLSFPTRKFHEPRSKPKLKLEHLKKLDEQFVKAKNNDYVILAKNYKVNRKIEKTYACFDYSGKLMKLMNKLSRIGFELGQGLGKNKQGIVNPVREFRRFLYKSGFGKFKGRSNLVYVLVDSSEHGGELKIENNENDNAICEPETKKLKIEKT